MNKDLYPNTTQVPNAIIDEMAKFTDAEFRILMLIVRKTIGWHKETDYISYTQFHKYTGIKSRTTLSLAVNNLVKKGYVKRIDKRGKSLDPMPKGFRSEVYYTLNKRVLNSTSPKNEQVLMSKNYTSTGVKNGHYKTNSYKTNNTLAKPKQLKKENNVDNLLITNSKVISDLSPTLLRKMEDMKKRIGVKSNVYTSHQAYGLEVSKELNLPETFTARVIKACKDKSYFDIHYALSATLKKDKMNYNDRAKYFFKVLQQKEPANSLRRVMPSL